MTEKILQTIPEACCTLDITGAEQDKLVVMFKAIGNPLRFEIMKFLVTRLPRLPSRSTSRYCARLAGSRALLRGQPRAIACMRKTSPGFV
jgi:hypothetical protein